MAIREEATIGEVIHLLNELIDLDRPAMGALFANRVPCNPSLADHPTVQVGMQHGGYHVGLMGILNGLFGVDDNGWGPIALVFDDKPSGGCDLLRVERVSGGMKEGKV